MIHKQSFAKINLVLRVLGKRADGYHDILSLMQRISLHDEMTFERRHAGIVCRCPGSGLPEDDGNIVCRAARWFFTETALSGGVEIGITKLIPIAAGLGGGSSNAATTLIALNEMYGYPLVEADLMRIGAAIGADVPFFLGDGPAWASGIGERLTRLSGLPRFPVVLVNPGFPLSTGTVYDALKMGLTKAGIQYTIPSLTTTPDIVRELHNDLERVSLRLHPVLAKIKHQLTVYGASGALMSGSGPTVFGIFEGDADAREAEMRLERDGLGRVFRAVTV